MLSDDCIIYISQYIPCKYIGKYIISLSLPIYVKEYIISSKINESTIDLICESYTLTSYLLENRLISYDDKYSIFNALFANNNIVGLDYIKDYIVNYPETDLRIKLYKTISECNDRLLVFLVDKIIYLKYKYIHLAADVSKNTLCNNNIINKKLMSVELDYLYLSNLRKFCIQDNDYMIKLILNTINHFKRSKGSFKVYSLVKSSIKFDKFKSFTTLLDYIDPSERFNKVIYLIFKYKKTRHLEYLFRKFNYITKEYHSVIYELAMEYANDDIYYVICKANILPKKYLNDIMARIYLRLNIALPLLQIIENEMSPLVYKMCIKKLYKCDIYNNILLNYKKACKIISEIELSYLQQGLVSKAQLLINNRLDISRYNNNTWSIIIENNNNEVVSSIMNDKFKGVILTGFNKALSILESKSNYRLIYKHILYRTLWD